MNLYICPIITGTFFLLALEQGVNDKLVLQSTHSRRDQLVDQKNKAEARKWHQKPDYNRCSRRDHNDYNTTTTVAVVVVVVVLVKISKLNYSEILS